jgi:hypothetical protein
LGHEADHSPPSSAEIKNDGAVPPHHPILRLSSISEPALWKLVTFQVTHLMSTCVCLHRFKESETLHNIYVTSFLYNEELLTPRPTPKLENHPLLAVRDCLFSVFAAALHIWSSVPHPQPENAPCRGDLTRMQNTQSIKIFRMILRLKP